MPTPILAPVFWFSNDRAFSLGPMTIFQRPIRVSPPAALIVTRGLVPSHPTMRSYIDNMAITNAWVPDGLRAQDRVLGWWDRDFDHQAEACDKKSACWLSIVSAVRQKQVNVGVDLIHQGR
jgi:hypothetical protein